MKTLTVNQMKLVSGGADAKKEGMVCNGDGSICQTSTGLTIIKSVSTVEVEGDFGVKLLFKQLAGVEGKLGYTEKTTTTTVCTEKLDCVVVDKKVEKIEHKRSDATDDAAFERFADDDGFDGGDWAGGDRGGSGGAAALGGGGWEEEFENAVC